MTEKLTPEEIKKALECCGKPYNLCDECPISNDIKDDCKCGEHLAKHALDLINRQQTAIDVYMQENDRLKTAYIQVSMDRDTMLEDLQFRTNQVIEQQAEIERLTVNMNAFGLGMKQEKERADTIRAEAFKEFAERLKNECAFECDVSLGYGRPCYEDAIPIIAIDNLVKEMVGEQE